MRGKGTWTPLTLSCIDRAHASKTRELQRYVVPFVPPKHHHHHHHHPLTMCVFDMCDVRTEKAALVMSLQLRNISALLAK